MRYHLIYKRERASRLWNADRREKCGKKSCEEIS